MFFLLSCLCESRIFCVTVVVFHPQHANEDVERMLLGNKCDMEDKRVVPKAKGEQVRAQAKKKENLQIYIE